MRLLLDISLTGSAKYASGTGLLLEEEKYQRLTGWVLAVQIWLVRNSSCQAKGVAQPGLWQSERTVAETTLRQSGNAMMALSRKFLRDAAGLFSAI